MSMSSILIHIYPKKTRRALYTTERMNIRTLYASTYWAIMIGLKTPYFEHAKLDLGLTNFSVERALLPVAILPRVGDAEW
jgi:hypothetical protein